MMISLGEKEKRIPMYAFKANGKSIFSNKINGHFMWDTNPAMCDEDCDCWMDQEDEDETEEEEKRSHRPCKPPPKPRKPEPENRPWVAFRKPPTPLPLDDEMITILRAKEKKLSCFSPPPPNDENLITWPPLPSCKKEAEQHATPTPSIPLMGECMMFSDSQDPYPEEDEEEELPPFIRRSETNKRIQS
ncbi:hypothetical protein Fmac_024601 [Flemingia macrophylla]|uniref:Uncharacterized protein n=1 Tax=Flemingia macrophylla TaxID=520843 RepID=A0ABD1LPU1_9FABA